MKTRKHLLQKISSIFALSLFFSSQAIAGTGSITYVPLNVPPIVGANNIPTLSGTMLMILSMILMAVVYKTSKQNDSNGSNFFLAIISVTALVSGTTGISLISDVEAESTSISSFFSKPDGDTLTFNDNTLVTFQNSSGVTQKITGIIAPPNSGCGSPEEFRPTCSISLVIENGQSCSIRCNTSLIIKPIE